MAVHRVHCIGSEREAVSWAILLDKSHDRCRGAAGVAPLLPGKQLQHLPASRVYLGIGRKRAFNRSPGGPNRCPKGSRYDGDDAHAERFDFARETCRQGFERSLGYASRGEPPL